MRAAALLGTLIVAALTACSQAAADAPDLTPRGAFDAKADRERVVYCLGVHLSMAQLGADVLGLDEATWQAADRPVQARFQRLKPFASAIERTENLGPGGLMRDAGAQGDVWMNGIRARAVTGDKKALLDEAVAVSLKCDALAQSWGSPPA